jgi:succinate-semialdehyde dehydrogenase / glutarate-semialdehyde dehydrogenase
MLVVGGKSPDAGGYLIQPALLTGVTSKMLVAREETFGPLAPLFKFEMEDDVVAQANDTSYGVWASRILILE